MCYNSVNLILIYTILENVFTLPLSGADMVEKRMYELPRFSLESMVRVVVCSCVSVSTGDSMQYGVYPAERDCYQTMNSTYKAQSMNNLYRKEPCQSPTEPAPVPPSFAPSFASVAARMDRTMDVAGHYLPEETWSAPSVPLTNEFRYNTSEAVPYVPQASAPAPFNGYVTKPRRNVLIVSLYSHV
ncbi:unnamed protein product, partial [Oncorhynchus mykiss]